MSLGMRCLARAPIAKKCAKIKNVSREMFLSQSKRVQKIIRITDQRSDQRANARPAQCAKCTPQGSCCSASPYLPPILGKGMKGCEMNMLLCFSCRERQQREYRDIERISKISHEECHMHEPIQPWAMGHDFVW